MVDVNDISRGNYIFKLTLKSPVVIENWPKLEKKAYHFWCFSQSKAL